MWYSHNLYKKTKSMVRKCTCRPSKKLSPIMMTVEPPVVQPSLGDIALMHGIAADGYRPRKNVV